MWVSMCFSRALDSYFIVKMPPYSLPKIATRGVRPGYEDTGRVRGEFVAAHSLLALRGGDQ